MLLGCGYDGVICDWRFGALSQTSVQASWIYQGYTIIYIQISRIFNFGVFEWKPLELDDREVVPGGGNRVSKKMLKIDWLPESNEPTPMSLCHYVPNVQYGSFIMQSMSLHC